MQNSEICSGTVSSTAYCQFFKYLQIRYEWYNDHDIGLNGTNFNLLTYFLLNVAVEKSHSISYPFFHSMKPPDFTPNQWLTPYMKPIFLCFAGSNTNYM